MRAPPNRTAIIPSNQTPFLEYASQGIWHLWLTHSTDFRAGTFLVLMPDGRIFSDTLNRDGSITRGVVKPTVEDKFIQRLIQQSQTHLKQDKSK